MEYIYSRDVVLNILKNDASYLASKKYVEENEEPSRQVFYWDVVRKGIFRTKKLEAPDGYCEHRHKCFTWLVHDLQAKEFDAEIERLEKSSAYSVIWNGKLPSISFLIVQVLLENSYCKILEENK